MNAKEKIVLDYSDGTQPIPPMPVSIFVQTIRLLEQVAECQGRDRITTSEVFNPWNEWHQKKQEASPRP